ncbi:S24 family peptidase [Arsenophonus sp.]|uniref:LexA family transcriptional regulator n=1 Tax=Arsenophonus sp. TaxID=1872640 RepID=UPI00285B7F1D|nr:S24 family peptidase [Arsenophonus sp.]MDR5611273.1 S24 family peptidase [Arsenophonus sp.]MDR5615287.1 S24 family peptidase [Arsenophonus sp.]
MAKTKMKEKGLSQEKLGEILGKTQGAIAHWLNGRREPSIEDIAKIMKVLGISEINLNSDANVKEIKQDKIEFIGVLKEGSVPVVGEAMMGIDGEFDMSENLSGYLQIFSADPRAFSVRVKGDSMFPRINSGEFVVIEPSTSITAGDDVFVRTEQGKNMIKRLGYNREGTYQFLSINQQHPPLTMSEKEIEVVYFVAAIVKSSRYLDLI